MVRETMAQQGACLFCKRLEKGRGILRDRRAVFVQARQVPIDPAEQLKVDEELVHRRVADALPDPERAGVHAVRAGFEGPDGVGDTEAAVLVAVPVDLDFRV